jgi:K+-sensing histidine kinase KdpD
MPQQPARRLHSSEEAVPSLLSVCEKAPMDHESGRVDGEGSFAHMSHQVRTCLAIITFLSGNLDLLYERLDDDKRRKMIRDIRKHAQNLATFLEKVLDPGEQGAISP